MRLFGEATEKKKKPAPKTDKPAESKKAAPKKSRTTKAPAKKPATASPGEAGKPASIARPKSPDDLKLISGVGPKLEGILNGLGIYAYSQIAGWNPDEIEWVDGYLKFKGRIARDSWLDQADALATGGVDEYIRRFGKKPR